MCSGDAPQTDTAASPGRPLALLVLTRDPTGRMTGRKMVLTTAARGLEQSGFRVEAVVLSRHPVPASWDGRPLHRVDLPPLARVGLNAARVILRGRGTLNEALFDSPQVRRRTAQFADERGADAVVADGLRTTGAAMACGLPVVIHLDDLLSDRYAAMAGTATSSTDVLGYFATQLPAALRRPASALARRLLGIEARRVDRREHQLAYDADVVAMTSQDEADELTRRTGRAVVALPMSVTAREPGDPSAAPASSFVFLGVLDYAPNQQALAWWVAQVLPALDAAGGGDITLTVVGHRTHESGALADPRLRFTGYVDDLGEELRRHRGMVAPVLSGAGVKTKVLDGWSVGLPVVATPAGAAGLPRDDGLIVATDAAGFAAAVLHLRHDGALASRTGRAGWQALQRDWSPEAVGERWGGTVRPLLRKDTRSAETFSGRRHEGVPGIGERPY